MKLHSFILSISLVASILSLTSCASSNKSDEAKISSDTANEISDQQQPLNISVYLDLSDRLVREMTPSQMERDTAIINQVVDIFLKDCQDPAKGRIAKTRNHFQVFFYPDPNISEIATLAKGLNYDLSKVSVKEKKRLLKGMKEKVQNNIEQIYNEAINKHKWVGSDIWGFFSNGKVDNYCIRDGYRNVLFILTDGYLFYEPNKQKEGNAYSYVLPSTLAIDGSSLIIKRSGLEDLEVIMLEVNPYSPKEHDLLINVLQNWFKGMDVSSFVVVETDLPDRTQAVIEDFMQLK